MRFSMLGNNVSAALGALVLCGALGACGAEETKPTTTPPPVVTTDGGGGTDDTTGEDSGTPPVATGCTTGTTQACACEGSDVMGTQACVGGAFAGPCSGCPCVDGTTSSCSADASCASGVGTALCTAGTPGACECVEIVAPTTNSGTGCPTDFTCTTIMDPLSLCVKGGELAPPGCEEDADCAALGLSVTCTTNPLAFPPFVPAKICAQPCVP